MHRGRTLALVAEPIVPAGTVDPHSCHGCSHFYQYLVFGWRHDRGAFAPLQVLQGKREFEEGDDPLRHDIDFVASKLRL